VKAAATRSARTRTNMLGIIGRLPVFTTAVALREERPTCRTVAGPRPPAEADRRKGHRHGLDR
jgi:hypothetical protein